MSEIDKLKGLVLSEKQLLLFNFIAEPKLYENEMEYVKDMNDNNYFER